MFNKFKEDQRKADEAWATHKPQPHANSRRSSVTNQHSDKACQIEMT